MPTVGDLDERLGEYLQDNVDELISQSGDPRGHVYKKVVADYVEPADRASVRTY
jgi:hypothetical protein